MTSSDGNNHGQSRAHGPIDGFDNDPFADLTELLEQNFAPVATEQPVSWTAIVETAAGNSAVELSDDERLDRALAELADVPVAHEAYAADRLGGISVDADPGTLDFEAEFAEALDAELDPERYRSVVIARAPSKRQVEADAPLQERAVAASTVVSDMSYSRWIAPHGAFEKPVQRSLAGEAMAPASRPADLSDSAGLAEDSFASDLDSELESALSGLSAPANPRQTPFHRSEAFAPERAEPVHADPFEDKPFDDFDELIASEMAAMRPIPVAATHASPHAASAGASSGAHFEPGSSDDAFDDEEDARTVSRTTSRAAPAILAASAARSNGRGWGLGASVLAIAVIGGLGAYVLTGDDLIGAPSDVLVVKADQSPVKVAPEDPGGRSIPNQNKAVYERVQSAAADVKPAQTTLLTAVEEPVDLPRSEDNGLPGVDLNPITGARAAESLVRADAASQPEASTPAQDDPNVLQPRRVRTMTVRPDGTLVVEDVQPSVGPSTTAVAPAMLEAAARPIATPSVTAALAEPEAATPVSTASVAPAPETEPVRTASIGKPEPIAAAAPTATSAYYVQISSQPSEEAAQQSQRNLTKRYASVIGGRNVVIQSAAIAGKGTYYRVRVGADSRDEANTLCASLKSSGGNCFVSR